MGSVPSSISRRIVRLTCGIRARAIVSAPNAANHSASCSRTRSKSWNAQRSKRSALRSDGRSANRIAVTPQPERHPVAPDPGRPVDDEPLEARAVVPGEARREAAAERMCHEHRGLLAGQPEERAEPIRERRCVQPRDRLGLAQAGEVGDDDAMALREPGHDRRPDRPAAFDPAVEEDQRRSVTALEHGGRRTRQVEPPLGHGESGQHPLARRAGGGDRAHDRRFPSTTGMVCPSTSVGLNSTISAPA